MGIFDSIHEAQYNVRTKVAQDILKHLFQLTPPAASIRKIQDSYPDSLARKLAPAIFATNWIQENLSALLECDEINKVRKCIRYLLASRWLMQKELSVPNLLLLEIQKTLNLNSEYLHDRVELLLDPLGDQRETQTAIEFSDLLLLEIAAKYSWCGEFADHVLSDIANMRLK